MRGEMTDTPPATGAAAYLYPLASRSPSSFPRTTRRRAFGACLTKICARTTPMRKSLSWTTAAPTARATNWTGLPVRVLRHPVNLGNGASVKTGIRKAHGDFVLLLDADGQHSPEDVGEPLAVRGAVRPRSWSAR